METPILSQLSPKSAIELISHMTQLQALCIKCQQEIGALWQQGLYHPFSPNENWFGDPKQPMLMQDEHYYSPTREAANDAAKAIMLKRQEMLDKGWQTHVRDFHRFDGGRYRPCISASLVLFAQLLPWQQEQINDAIARNTQGQHQPGQA